MMSFYICANLFWNIFIAIHFRHDSTPSNNIAATAPQFISYQVCCAIVASSRPPTLQSARWLGARWMSRCPAAPNGSALHPPKRASRLWTGQTLYWKCFLEQKWPCWVNLRSTLISFTLDRNEVIYHNWPRMVFQWTRPLHSSPHIPIKVISFSGSPSYVICGWCRTGTMARWSQSRVKNHWRNRKEYSPKTLSSRPMSATPLLTGWRPRLWESAEDTRTLGSKPRNMIQGCTTLNLTEHTEINVVFQWGEKKDQGSRCKRSSIPHGQQKG